MSKYELIYAVLPGWFFILKGHYFKGIIYFIGFCILVYLSFFTDFNFPVPAGLLIGLVWLISVIDSVILNQQYNAKIDSEKVISIFLHNKYEPNIEFPFYIIEFYNALKSAKSNPKKLVKAMKRLSKVELPPDWKNFVGFYKNIQL